MSKSVSAQAMEFTETPVSKKVRPAVAVKEIEHQIDNFGLGRILWYMVRRWKLQLSILINVYYIGAPLFRFIHQFFQ